jgi:hypothetical protein
VVRVHVAIGEEAIGEEGEQDELGQRQELVTRQGEARSSAMCQWVHLARQLRTTDLSSRVMFSSEPPSVLMGGATLVCET